MKIYFFTKGDINMASSRVRVFMVADLLNKNYGYSVCVKALDMIPWWNVKVNRFKNFIDIFTIFLNSKKDDVFYLHKTVFQVDFIFIVVVFKFFKNIKYIFDYDDAIFLHSPVKTYLLTRLANSVVVGSHYLYEYASRINKNCFIIPTSVDVDKYKINFKNNHIPIIGWIGGATHLDNLKILLPVFKKLIEEQILFKFILGTSVKHKEILKLFENINSLDVEYVDLDGTNFEKSIQTLRRFDIGIMPLINNDLNKGKCSFKAIEYMACSVSSVCSGVGENNYLINSGEDGFLVNSLGEWVDVLKKMISSHELRKSIGIIGKIKINKYYSYQENMPKLKTIINSL